VHQVVGDLDVIEGPVEAVTVGDVATEDLTALIAQVIRAGRVAYERADIPA
jgi:hypothetical protein